jgi:hypothetical protein
MSRLNSNDFQDVVDLINAINALGNTGYGNNTGFTCQEIIDSLRIQVPANTMSDAEVCDTLTRGVRSGVFRRNNLSDSCPAAPTVEDASCDSSLITSSRFWINQNMVNADNRNKVYADYFNGLAAARRGPIAVTYNPCYLDDGNFYGGSGTIGNCPNVGTG